MTEYMVLPFVYSKCHWAEVCKKPDEQKIKIRSSVSYTKICTKCGEPCDKVTQAEINEVISDMLKIIYPYSHDHKQECHQRSK